MAPVTGEPNKLLETEELGCSFCVVSPCLLPVSFDVFGVVSTPLLPVGGMEPNDCEKENPLAGLFSLVAPSTVSFDFVVLSLDEVF